jgi:hypothetical protein
VALYHGQHVTLAKGLKCELHARLSLLEAGRIMDGEMRTGARRTSGCHVSHPTDAAELSSLAPRGLVVFQTETACLRRGSQHPRSTPKMMASMQEVPGDVLKRQGLGSAMTASIRTAVVVST